MTAPAAPSISVRFDGTKARVRWRPVPDATDYKLYVDYPSTARGLEDDIPDDDMGSDGWFHLTFIPDELPVAIDVTALNVGAEESAASNVITVGSGSGAGTSFGKASDPEDPRNMVDPFGAY